MRSNNKGELSPVHIDPFDLLGRIGEISCSMLRKYEPKELHYERLHMGARGERSKRTF